MKIKLVGGVNELELGTVEDGVYNETGLLADNAHRWKILMWINTELEAGTIIRVVKTGL